MRSLRNAPTEFGLPIPMSLSRRTHSNLGYPKLELVSLLTQLMSCPMNRARLATALHLVAQMRARPATRFPAGFPNEKPAEDEFPPLGCPHDE